MPRAEHAEPYDDRVRAPRPETQAKAAMATQSEKVFGVKLEAHSKDDIALVFDNERKGDVDSLFTAKGLHLLMERKARIPSYDAACDVMAQVKKTAHWYKRLGMNVEKDGTPCDVKSVVFAEAMAPEAQAVLLDEGIYVLRPADMQVYAPRAHRHPRTELTAATCAHNA